MRGEVTLERRSYAGLFMVTLATLMYEILLTRIFSVTMWYHYAFVAISVAMFGMTVGAILVYLLPNYFTQARARYHLAISSLLFAISIVLSFLTHLTIPFITDVSLVGLYSIALTYAMLSIPFVFSGICVSLALTKFPRHLSKLYAADLAGAAVGCIVLIYTLSLTDGPTAVIVVAFLASVGTLFFLPSAASRRLRGIALACSALLVAFAIGHTVLVANQAAWLRLIWVKGSFEYRPLYEKWNSFSRVSVTGDPSKRETPVAWGLSPTYPKDRLVRQLFMRIDATAGTVLTNFDGNLDSSDLEHLKYDVTNVAHYVRPNSNVLVVGTGGGRDILSALVFKQKSVLGVEINKEIIDTVNQRFGDFTGHLDKNPKVTFVNDEARSYIARSKDKFDIIQVSLIDTWAATASGAFVLTENSLYTVGAWKILLNHLSPGGMLTFSRWYFQGVPSEMYRLTSLASASLAQAGVEKPRDHIVILRRMLRFGVADEPDGIGTMLVSREPFSESDLNTIQQVADKMQFDVVLSPRVAMDATFAALASGKDLQEFASSFPVNIAAPTDDSPYFFNMLRLRDVFNRDLQKQGILSFNMKAVMVLGVLLFVVVGLTILCIVVPVALTTGRKALKEAGALSVFFACIGLGFMLVEVSQVQRLIVFLGHPTYALSVVLFTLLLSSGLGSYSTDRVGIAGTRNSGTMRLPFLLGALAVFGVLTPLATNVFQGAETVVRIAVAVGLLFPLGLFMGMAFPLGMRAAGRKSPLLTPWLWGINGAMSVFASVLAVVIALTSGISVAFWTGFGCYVVGVAAFAWATRGEVQEPVPAPKGHVEESLSGATQ